MRLPELQTFSFLVGFITATLFWWLLNRMRPLWGEMRESWQKSREEAQLRRSTGVEENHRRATLRRAQGMHLAAPLFALNEILETPRILTPPPRIEPGAAPATEDIVAQTVPYLPAWPEIAGVYNAPSLTLPQALSGGMNLVITGQPGTGKTVALAHIATLAANRDQELGELSERIPFFYHIADLQLPVNDPKDVLKPIIDAASEHAPVMDLARLPNFVELAFKSGQALFLLDGFDELAPEGQAEASEFLKHLLKGYPKIQVLTTGCPEHLDGLIALGFVPLTIMPWTSRQRSEFINKWGQLWTQNVAVEAWAQSLPEQIDTILLNSWLNTDYQLLTPLELTLKIWAAYAGDSLGPHVLDAIAAHIRRLAPANVPLAALETLGMQVIMASQPIFDPRKAREWVKSFELPEERNAAETAVQGEGTEPGKTGPLEQKGKTGPLGKTGPPGQKGKTGPLPALSGVLSKMIESGLVVNYPNNKARFLHPVFAGYLAGRALSDYNADELLLEQANWSGKLLALRYMAVYGDATSLVEALLRETDMPLHQPLFIAARWLRDASREAAWRPKVFSRLAELLQTEGIPLSLRAAAVAAFVWSGDPGVQPLFRQFLHTTSFELLQLAALGCGAVKDAKAIETLSGVLYAPSVSAQRAGCLALVAIGANPAMEAVARALLHGEEDLRRAAAEAMANDPHEGHAMLREGTTLADILLRRAVIYGLARVDEPWAIEALQHMQVEDDQWVVRNSASEVLDSKAVQDPRVPKPLPPPSETPWLIEFAGKQGVGISPGSPATEILLAALKSDVEEERLASLPYLKRTPNEGIVTSLYHAMYRDDPELREAVFLVLCELAAGGIKLPHPQQFGLG